MLWIRLGDAGDYTSFDSIEDVAEEFQMEGIEEIFFHGQYGVTANDFEGNNYISIYWGDDDAEASRGLTEEEIAEINNLLRVLKSLHKNHQA